MMEILTTSSVLILILLLLRRIVGDRIDMRLRYGLWLVAALRLVLPAPLGNSAVSVMNLYPESWRAGLYAQDGESRNREQMADLRKETAGTDGEAGEDLLAAEQGKNGQNQNPASPEAEPGSAAQIPKYGADAEAGQNAAGAEALRQGEAGRLPGTEAAWVRGALWFCWLAGALAVGGYMAVSQLRFVGLLRRKRKGVDWEQVPEKFAALLENKGIDIYLVDGLASPCLVGRAVYIDSQMLEEKKRLPHILAHEYCHARQHDALWAFVRCVLTAVYWFDPLVWAAAFAARQDSELACDQAAIRLLGEEERFAYGRTLLYLLERGGSITCAGAASAMEGGPRGVRERVSRIAAHGRPQKWAVAVSALTVCLACGCAFTGADKEEASRTEEQVQAAQTENVPARTEGTQKAVSEQEAFVQALEYHGVMEGRDDSELFLNRKMDYQAYRACQQGEGGSLPENGWYLLCRSEEADISLYGLYTETTGFRGIKTLIGEDVNTYDMVWCPAYMNEDSSNIRVLEQAADKMPRRFVFKLLSENTGTTEIWRLYSGFRYDTGTVSLEELTPQQYRSWAEAALSFTVDEEQGKVLVTCDGDMLLGELDISGYRGLQVEEVGISSDVVSFGLDSDAYGREEQNGYEGVVLYLAAGLKLAGSEEIWIDGLHPFMVQVLCHENGSGFVLQKPEIVEDSVMTSPMQKRKLEELLHGTEFLYGTENPDDGGMGADVRSIADTGADAGDSAGAGLDAEAADSRDGLRTPLVNTEDGAHHDLEIDFVNPCPDYSRISNGYEERVHPVTGERIRHNGVDLAAPAGADILAAADGRVYQTGFDVVNGNYVVLWHPDSGQMTYYTHCREVLVSRQDEVAAGEKIAAVGQTGSATGNFLHFAVSYEGEWEEPVFTE